MRFPFSMIVITGVCAVSCAFAADLVPQDGAQADSPFLRREVVVASPEAQGLNGVEWTESSAAQAPQAEDRAYLINFATHVVGKPIWQTGGTVVLSGSPNTMATWQYQMGDRTIRVNLSNTTAIDTVWLDFSADQLSPATALGQPSEIKDFLRYQQPLKLRVNETMRLESGKTGEFDIYIRTSRTPDEVLEGNNRLLVTRVR